MKTRILKKSPNALIAVLVLSSILLSCGRLPKPDFTYAPMDNPEAGDSIWFSNESSISERYEWEFGDGGISNQSNPTHVYKEAGIYEVTLTAYNPSGENFLSQSISINEPTILGLISYDSSGTKLLSGTSIWVYDNENDRDNLIAPLFSKTTDSTGVVEFRNVDSRGYHVWAFKEDADGWWSFWGYTSILKQNKVNYFTFNCNWTVDAPHQ